jgi:hypothetical protein
MPEYYGRPCQRAIDDVDGKIRLRAIANKGPAWWDGLDLGTDEACEAPLNAQALGVSSVNAVADYWSACSADQA